MFTHEFTPDCIDDRNKYKRIVEYPYEEKINYFVVGQNHGYILTHQNKLLELNLAYFLN